MNDKEIADLLYNNAKPKQPTPKPGERIDPAAQQEADWARRLFGSPEPQKVIPAKGKKQK